MKEIKLSVDLNELSDDELALYLKLKSKSNVNAEKAVDDEVQQLIKEKAKYVPDAEIERKSRTRTSKDKLFADVREKMINEKVSFSTAYRKLNGGVQTGGKTYQEYREWCKEKGYDDSLLFNADDIMSNKKTGKRTYHHKRHRKSTAFYKREYDQWQPVWEIMRDGKGEMTLNQAVQKVYKRSAVGSDYGRYRKFCFRRNRKTFMPPKRRYNFKNKDKHTLSQLAKKNPFLQFKNRHIGEYSKRMNVRVQVAMKMLAQIWNNNNRDVKLADSAVKSSYNLLFPDLIGKGITNDGLHQIIVDMFRNVINISGTALSYKMEGSIIGITNANQWENFCENVMLNAKEIAQFFGVENKFVISGAGIERTIRYENKK